jgi:hypothetical protein
MNRRAFIAGLGGVAEAILAVIGISSSSNLHAETYPSKPIQMYVSFRNWIAADGSRGINVDGASAMAKRMEHMEHPEQLHKINGLRRSASWNKRDARTEQAIKIDPSGSPPTH